MAYRQNGMACLGIWSILGANPFPSLDSKRSHYVIRIVRAGVLDRDWRPDLRGSSDARAGPLDRRRRYRAAGNRNCHGCTKYSAERSFLTRWASWFSSVQKYSKEDADDFRRSRITVRGNHQELKDPVPSCPAYEPNSNDCEYSQTFLHIQYKRIASLRPNATSAMLLLRRIARCMYRRRQSG